MQEIIRQEICQYVKAYQERKDVSAVWGEPIVGYADAHSAYVRKLRGLVHPMHEMPEDVLPGATVVLVYYVPFTRALAQRNADAGRFAAPEWAQTCAETNAMFQQLNAHLIEFLSQKGHRAAVADGAYHYDEQRMASTWSHRHIACAAGLGTFGMNNMLLTQKGCCGRFSSVVTDLPFQPGRMLQEELCLYKQDGSCGICMQNCPVQALSAHGFDRQSCKAMLRENARSPQGAGSSVCAKCVTASPCMFWDRTP